MTSISPQVQNLWVPLAQIVPVFSIALALEVRELRKNWRLDAKISRRAQSIVFYVIAYLLAQVESVALLHMQKGNTDPIWESLSVASVLVAMLLLSIQPITNALIEGNIDVVYRMGNLVPFSERARSKRRLKAMQAKFSAASVDLIDTTDVYYERFEREKMRRNAWRDRVILLEGALEDPVSQMKVNLTEDEMTQQLLEAQGHLTIAKKNVKKMRSLLREGHSIYIDLDELITEMEETRKQVQADYFDAEETERMQEIVNNGQNWNASLRNTTAGPTPEAQKKPSGAQ